MVVLALLLFLLLLLSSLLLLLLLVVLLSVLSLRGITAFIVSIMVVIFSSPRIVIDGVVIVSGLIAKMTTDKRKKTQAKQQTNKQTNKGC